MPRISYVNGRFIRHSHAAVHIEDRGYQFADAIYEVIAIVRGRLIDDQLHFERLERSLREIRMELPFSRDIFRMKVTELLRLNRLLTGTLYLQVSRGVAPRNHKIPGPMRPSVVMTVQPLREVPAAVVEQGVPVITVPDIRWKRPDIKSVALLPNVLAKDDAVQRNVYEAWQVDADGIVTEGTSTNAWIVKDGMLITHPAASSILNGVTRLALLKIAADIDIRFDERPFSVSEAYAADEAFLSSTSAFLVPIVKIDDKQIGTGAPGPISTSLLARYKAHLWSRDA
ncbi:MAG: D-alanine transaminase [Alphaproteobacteria bacterium]|jgi:D-alanine transaminase